jgi:hypothetical protein
MSEKKIHKSANGKVVDMERLRNQNEMSLAVGNAKINARGDEIGPGGKIVRRREDLQDDYYKGKN